MPKKVFLWVEAIKHPLAIIWSRMSQVTRAVLFQQREYDRHTPPIHTVLCVDVTASAGKYARERVIVSRSF